MKFEVLIHLDGRREHVVTERAEGENCDRIFQYNAGTMVSDERTGPDCDTVQEITT